MPTKPGDYGLLLKFSVAEKEKATERRVSLSSGITGQNSCPKIITVILLFW
jgi:hypothetical protein